MRHQAVYNTHPKVTSIKEGDPWEYLDENNNNVEIDESLVTPELEKLQAEVDAQEYAFHREREYPSILELIVALYDTDDKAAIDTKRAAVKVKWPKDNSGPVE